MNIDYTQVGKRIARCRKAQGLTQATLSELAEISPTYMSSIERAKSIPSTEVIMRLAAALDTTPDEFLVGTARREGGEEWRSVADLLRPLNQKQLALASGFLAWLSDQDIK